MKSNSPKQSIVFVVAHPDDVPFSMGGTAALLKDRYDLHVLCATRGERGYKWKGPGLAPPDEEIAAARANEEIASCKLLGAKLTFLGLSDGEIFADREACETVARHLAEIKPVAIFTHGPTAKSDHAATCLIARMAMSLAGIFWETELYMAESLRMANIFVNISSVIEAKKELVFCHQHHLHDPSFWDSILEGDRAAGSLGRCELAEAYYTEMPLTTERWDRKAGSILMDLVP